MDTQTAIQEKYHLRPNNHLKIFNIFDNDEQYGFLNEISSSSFQKENGELPNTLSSHKAIYPNVLNSEAVDYFLSFLHEKDLRSRSPEEILPLVRLAITPEIDQAVKSYFGSHYMVMWASFSVIKSDEEERRYFTKWHCDAGPSKHLKAITYLNSSDDHGSTTMVADGETTNRLKEVGYILNDKEKRQANIEDLVEHFGIPFEPESTRFNAGDTLLFNPAQIAHRADVPKPGATRYSFTLCFIPSPVPWNVLVERGLPCRIGCRPFENYAQDVLKAASGKKSANADGDVIELNYKSIIHDSVSLLHHLNIIFDDKNYAQRIHDLILKASGPRLNFNVHDLVAKLKVSFQSDLNWKTYFSNEDLNNLQKLLEFEKRHVHSHTRFRPQGKPDPDAVFWPIPTHAKHPKNKFDMLPFVNRHKIMDQSTPIGSAGSCFAFEIAEFLQAEGFNYVVEERADSPESGVFVDGYTAGDKYAKFSANYGLLFNTPSLRQLAEKTFGHREFTRYCYQAENKVVTDPYRENVYFTSKEAYLLDYPKHIAAVRRSLLKSKVFIFTAGLNECWQMHDGTVMSRNPRDGFTHLLSHKVLTVEENVENMKAFVNIVREENPDFKLIISLSPIPLLATGRAETHHIIEANTHSKAVLRVAIDQVVNEMEGVYYLPSYELVNECTPDAWKDDHRHVKREVVSRVISMFKEIFVEE